MRKLLAICATLTLLSACSASVNGSVTPNGSTTGTTTGNDTSSGTSTGTSAGTSTTIGATTSVAAIMATKQSYISYLNCIKSKAKPEQQASIQASIDQVNKIDDGTWAIISATLRASAQAYLATFPTGC